jgi:thiol-disulfide isomerase/thioredoxin
MKTILFFMLLGMAPLTRPGSGPGLTPASTSTLQSPDGTRISWEDLLHRYTGKVIYLDLWASWCGPCRNQAPYYEALRAKFAQDSVVFLSISIDSDPQDWKDALGEQGTTPNHASFLLLDGHHSSLNSILHIDGVPRYALLDRSGRFVEKDAPFPSTPEAEAHLRALVHNGGNTP